MDTKTLIAESKARFNHNAAKKVLSEKYNAKLMVADQGGLWKADTQTIAFLGAMTTEFVVILDTFGNPIRVERHGLLTTLKKTYETAMSEWEVEWKELETKR